jgi:hypothetical protein
MSNSDVQSNYEVNVEILTKEYKDVDQLVFFRNPISKMASFTYLTMNLDTALCRNVIDMVSQNDYPKVHVKIFSVDESNPQEVCRDRKIVKIYDRELICIGANQKEEKNIDNNFKKIEMVLVNPIFYNLELKNSCNMVKNDISPYETVSTYEDWLKKTYGDVFYFRKIVNEDNQNKNKKIEHVLFNDKNDMALIENMMNTYNANLGISFYFFDDFYIEKDSKAIVTCHYINLSDVNRFKIIDYTYALQFNGIQIIKETPFYDRNLSDKRSSTASTTTSNTTHKHGPNSSSTPAKVEKQDPGTSETASIGGEEVTIPSSGQTQSVPYEGQTTNDSMKNSLTDISKKTGDDKEAEDLLEKNLNLIASTSTAIRSTVSVKNDKCLPNYYQFGNLYCIDIENMSGFHMSPINIVNIFCRRSGNDDDLEHQAYGLFLKYKLEGEQDTPKVQTA